MSLQRENVSKEFFLERVLEGGKKDSVLYFGLPSLNHFCKRELESKLGGWLLENAIF